MKTYQECLPCFERQVADVCAMAELSAEQIHTVQMAVQSKIRTFPRDCPPIKMALEIHALARSLSGIEDPYLEIKQQANRVCREYLPGFQNEVAQSSDPLKTAIQLAIAGNIIDCGAYGMREVRKEALCGVVHEALEAPLAANTVAEFSAVVGKARNILYIGDNAGECFFDGLLLRLLPAEKITYAVRGTPVLNDATMDDALAAGIHEICDIVDTGDCAPGILLDRCSTAFRKTFERSDVVIAKGQGNYESLSEFRDRVYVFLTKVKCEIIGEDIGHPLGSNVLMISGLGTPRRADFMMTGSRRE